MPQRTPAPYGPLDPHMVHRCHICSVAHGGQGISDKAGTCETCGLRLSDCAGHFGVMQLELPVFHVGFFKATLTVLQRICKARH